MKRKISFILIIVFSFLMSVKAENRTGFIEDTKYYINSSINTRLNDNNYTSNVNITTKDTIRLTSFEKFDSVYIIYYLKSSTGKLMANDKEIDIGKNAFLHEYIQLDTKTDEVTIKYDNNVVIKEIFIFSGNVPAWVQKWEPQLEEADIMLISTHSDDEHLFFAGLIPTMVANDKKMQVVYLAHHNNEPSRLDEQLNGLWAVGLKTYPVLGYIPDAYSESLNAAISNLKAGDLTLDDVINFEIDNIKRFKPQVVVAHDINGEYGHGQHRLSTHALMEAIKKMDEDDLPYKIYIHLYNENKLTMDYDTPLSYYNGKTAYEVSKLGYAEHKSQQYTWFTKWLNGKNNTFTKATDITTYSPIQYGLYYSKVGYEDEPSNMFSNIPKKVIEEPIDETIKTEQEKEVPKKKKKSYKKIYIVLGIIELILITLLITALRTKKKRQLNS